MPSGIFATLFIYPILNVLVGFYKLFLSLNLPGAFGFAIIALTLFVRFLLHPFFKQQMHTTKKMQHIKPHIDNLQKKHKNDPQKLQQEQLRLYQEAGINPLAGCLFAIVQIPVFIGLYQTLNLFLAQGVGPKVIAEINKTLYWPFLKIQSIDPNFFIFNLAATPSTQGPIETLYQPLKLGFLQFPWFEIHYHADKLGYWYYLLIPIITVVLQFYQSQTMLPATPAKKEKSTDEKKSDKKEKVEESSMGEDMQQAMNTQMKYILPVMIGVFSFTLPVGLSLYWNIFSIFSIIQHVHFEKWHAKNPIIIKK